MSKLAVIKYGGHAMEQQDLAKAFATAIYTLVEKQIKCIIVHGGGPQINELLTRLNIKSQFINGLRQTDAQTMDVVEMVLAGQVNKRVVSELAAANVKACGLSGRDGNLLTCEPLDAHLGRVGKITEVDTQLISILLANNITPVIAPIANDKNHQAYNVNADLCAGAIAGKLQADYFVLISDVAGVMDANKHIIPKLQALEIKHLIDTKIITGGMIPKIQSCLEALKLGSKQALILDGRQESSLSRFLFDNEPLGTLVVEE